ncbi:hypothetical protein GBAR_LOCUS19519 [Geodia barretti]|nr:hypothetical protein GBAR_LOCUS19519 [Geodia barretti]
MSRKWVVNWGFLPLQYQQLREDLGKSCAPVSTTTRSCALHLPPLPCPPQTTQLAFPKTTSREIGWRSGDKAYSLEVYGRWGRPKVSILHHLNWPHDAVE